MRTLGVIGLAVCFAGSASAADPLEAELAAARAAGEVARVEPRVVEALRRDPQDPDLWVLLGRVTGREVFLHEALALDPEHAPALAALAAVHRRLDQPEAALRSAEAAVAAGGTTPEGQVERLRALRLLGRDGTDAAREALEAAPDDAGVRVEAAAALPAEAARILAEGLERSPDDPALRRALVFVRLLEGDAASARPLLPEPDDRLGLVVDCVDAGTLDAAGVAIVRDAWSRPGLPVPGLDPLADARPPCPAVLLARAGVRHAVGDDEGAIRDLSRAVWLARDHVQAQLALGMALLDVGRRGEARAWLEVVRRRRPDDPTVLVAWASTVPPEEALPVLDAAGAAESWHPGLIVAHARALEQTGEPDRALEALLGAVGRMPGEATVVDAARAIARSLGRRHDLEDRLARARTARRPPTGTWVLPSDADEVIVVWGESEEERIREALDAKLVAMGYDRAKRSGDSVIYRSSAPITPWVRISDDGAVEVQAAGLVDMADGTRKIISVRKMRPRRERALRELWPVLEAWRRVRGEQAFGERLSDDLPGQLDALWQEGVPLQGGPILETYPARRQALLAFWASRTCTSEGDRVRDAVERFLEHEVQGSEWPATKQEIEAANRATGCERRLERGR